MTTEQHAEAIRLYESGIGSTTIAKALGVSKPSILSLLKRSGVSMRSHSEGQRLKHRKYFYNDTFFDSIDSEEKAYALGFFAADGCNFLKSNNVNFTCCDIDVLEKIKAAMGVDCPINAPKPAKDHYKPCYVLRLKSHHMCTTLEKIGFGPRKSMTCGFPDIPANLERHFIRGYFDGDGTVSYSIVNGHVMPKIGFCGSLSMLESISEKLPFHMCIRPRPGIFVSSAAARESVRYFFHYIYHDSIIQMDRKYVKYLKLLEYIDES